MMKKKGYKMGGKTKKGFKMGGRMKKGYKKGGKTSFPDLTGDGKVTQADILKGRGVGKKKGGSIKKMKKGGSIKKFKKGEVVDRPKVTPPTGDTPPMTKERLLEEQKNRNKNMSPRKKPEGLKPNTPMRPKAKPKSDTPGSASPRQFQPPKGKNTENKRGFTPGEQTPPNRKEPGGKFLPPNIVGRSKKPEIGTIKMRGGGMAKKGFAAGGRTKGGAKGGVKGGKSKVRGAGIARKGVRPTKMR